MDKWERGRLAGRVSEGVAPGIIIIIIIIIISILDRIQRRPLKWYGHLLRMEDSR